MSAQWYYADSSNQQLGPASVEAMQSAHARGDLGANSLVWREGMDEWKPMRQMASELGISVAANPSPPPVAAARPVVVAPKGSPWLLILIIVGVVVLFGGGILAAIAIPAYHDYSQRAKLTDVIAHASSVKIDVEEFVQTEQRCPGNEDAAFSDPAAHAQGMLQAVHVGTIDDGTDRCAINLVLHGVANADDEHSLLMIRNDSSDWVYNTTLPVRYLPASIRNRIED